jgi:hypothetical protein
MAISIAAFSYVVVKHAFSLHQNYARRMRFAAYLSCFFTSLVDLIVEAGL